MQDHINMQSHRKILSHQQFIRLSDGRVRGRGTRDELSRR